MVAALAAALAFGMVVATLEEPNKAAGAVYAFVAGWLVALAIAALLLAPVVAVRAARGVRPPWPSRGALAAALVAGGLVMFPEYTDFYIDASLAAEGGGVGACTGILPLAQLVHDSIADEPYAELYYFASCND
jgi:hypothetical protein